MCFASFSYENPSSHNSCDDSVVAFLCLYSLLLQWTDMKNRASPSRSCVTLSFTDFNSFRDVFVERGRNENIFHHLSELHGDNQMGATYTITKNKRFSTHRRRKNRFAKQQWCLFTILFFGEWWVENFIGKIEF